MGRILGHSRVKVRLMRCASAVRTLQLMTPGGVEEAKLLLTPQRDGLWCGFDCRLPCGCGIGLWLLYRYLQPLTRQARLIPTTTTSPGKYSATGAKPSGPRQLVYGEGRLREIVPVLDAVKAVADERGKSMAQVGALGGVFGDPRSGFLVIRLIANGLQGG